MSSAFDAAIAAINNYAGDSRDELINLIRDQANNLDASLEAGKNYIFFSGSGTMDIADVLAGRTVNNAGVANQTEAGRFLISQEVVTKLR